MSGNAWIEYVKLYRENNPHLSYKEAMTEASVSYKKLKVKYGGGGKQCEGCRYNSPDQRSHMGPGGCLADNSNTNSNSNNKNNSKSNSKAPKSKCEGCKYNSPDQRSHMGPGGCLADEDD